MLDLLLAIYGRTFGLLSARCQHVCLQLAQVEDEVERLKVQSVLAAQASMLQSSRAVVVLNARLAARATRAFRKRCNRTIVRETCRGELCPRLEVIESLASVGPMLHRRLLGRAVADSHEPLRTPPGRRL